MKSQMPLVILRRRSVNELVWRVMNDCICVHFLPPSRSSYVAFFLIVSAPSQKKNKETKQNKKKNKIGRHKINNWEKNFPL